MGAPQLVLSINTPTATFSFCTVPVLRFELIFIWLCVVVRVQCKRISNSSQWLIFDFLIEKKILLFVTCSNETTRVLGKFPVNFVNHCLDVGFGTRTLIVFDLLEVNSTSLWAKRAWKVLVGGKFSDYWFVVLWIRRATLSEIEILIKCGSWNVDFENLC